MNFLLDEGRAIYLQIITAIKQAIVRGELQPGEKLPSQRDLAMQARVNPNTIQRAYLELEREGITETKRGEGTFIRLNEEEVQAMKEEMAAVALHQFLQTMQAMGFSDQETWEWIHNQRNRHKGDERL